MSWTLTLSGHVADESKMEAVLGEIRGLAFSLDGIADRDAGDTFGGSFSGPNVSVTFPEPVPVPDETEPSDAAVADAASSDQGYEPRPRTIRVTCGWASARPGFISLVRPDRHRYPPLAPRRSTAEEP